jgi:hypothetical protein
MAKCYKCNQPIKFKELQFRDGNRRTIAINIDGSNHQTVCRRIVRETKRVYMATFGGR